MGEIRRYCLAPNSHWLKSGMEFMPRKADDTVSHGHFLGVGVWGLKFMVLPKGCEIPLGSLSSQGSHWDGGEGTLNFKTFSSSGWFHQQWWFPEIKDSSSHPMALILSPHRKASQGIYRMLEGGFEMYFSGKWLWLKGLLAHKLPLLYFSPSLPILTYHEYG